MYPSLFVSLSLFIYLFLYLFLSPTSIESCHPQIIYYISLFLPLSLMHSFFPLSLLSLSRYFSNSPLPFLSLVLSLSLYISLSLQHAFSLSLSLSLFHTLSLSISHPLALNPAGYRYWSVLGISILTAIMQMLCLTALHQHSLYTVFLLTFTALVNFHSFSNIRVALFIDEYEITWQNLSTLNVSISHSILYKLWWQILALS